MGLFNIFFSHTSNEFLKTIKNIRWKMELINGTKTSKSGFMRIIGKMALLKPNTSGSFFIKRKDTAKEPTIAKKHVFFRVVFLKDAYSL